MKPFVEERWAILPEELKIAVACRYLALPTISNIANETGIDKKKAMSIVDELRQCMCIKEKWAKIASSWAICYRFDCHETNEFVDRVIQELGGITVNGPQSYRLK